MGESTHEHGISIGIRPTPHTLPLETHNTYSVHLIIRKIKNLWPEAAKTLSVQVVVKLGDHFPKKQVEVKSKAERAAVKVGPLT